MSEQAELNLLQEKLRGRAEDKLNLILDDWLLPEGLSTGSGSLTATFLELKKSLFNVNIDKFLAQEVELFFAEFEELKERISKLRSKKKTLTCLK